MQKIFITGASGWLGNNLIHYILDPQNNLNIKAENIHALCLTEENTKFLNEVGINISTGDIRNIYDVEKFLKPAKGALIIHLCGIIHPQIHIGDFFDINYLGTKHLVEISQKVGVKKILLMSSNSPVGCNKSNCDEDIFTENSPFNPYMKYGRSKFLMEQYAQKFASHNNHPAITIVRAPWFYGPNQPLRQTVFFKMVKEGKFPIIGDGNNKRSMAYTENLAQGIMRAAISDKANGQIYWIADEDPYSMNEIITTVKNVLEKEFSIKCSNRQIKVPSIVSDIAYLADFSLQTAGLYHQKIHVLSEMNKNIFCSIKKAQSDLEYQPKFNLYQGMRNSIKWCLSNNINI